MTMRSMLSCWSGPVRFRRAIRHWPAFVALASAVMLLANVTGCRKHEAKKPETGPVEVTVVTVTPGDVPVSFEFVAQTQSSH